MGNLPLCLLFFILISVAPLSARTFLEDYGDLRESLVDETKYNFKVRPANETVINITLDLTTLNKLDIGSQTLTSTFLLYMSWIDERLTWPSTTNINYLIYSIKEIWTPNLVITNYVNDFGLIGIYEDGPVPLRVSYEGRVVWTLRVATTTTCQADITYYPYDTQTCQVQIMEWAHPFNEVDLVPEGIESSSFQSDGEWELLNASLESAGDIGAHNSTYKKIKYTFHFQRQFQWYIPLMMIPLGVLSLLMPGVFLVPVETGEKMSYALTVMLSFTVISSFLFETLPTVSVNYSLLGVYISATMTCGALMIVFSLVVLFFNHPADDNDRMRTVKALDICAFSFFFSLMVLMMICFLLILNHPIADKNVSVLGIMLGVPIVASVAICLVVIICACRRSSHIKDTGT
ncbi:neuronal acetylcholine receptor subunit beta-4-like [Haliotis rubra]|uniref:neuronal acetylcholine receptor subunit beta-4-like n=1 Tax=Haliotis rubra TaxID=36100 RepID=UPI001EE604E0|nr:neuronal acetylcholine receptor subunit beta-4-like [Haliotis rubra]XP_046582682.1 neuronal acetylcholine receptor subunit beta-4-like [Haliotis rubra]